MSNPYGVSYAVISGQENAGEIVVAASTILLMDWQSITPVSTDKNIRKEFLLALEAFNWRERRPIDDFKKGELAQKVIHPNSVTPNSSKFWIALDKQGYDLAKDIFLTNKELIEQPVHKSICKLNLIEQLIIPPPQTKTTTDFWTNITSGISLLMYRQQAEVSKTSYQSFINTYVPITQVESEYYAWFKSLYEILLPWRQSIGTFQADLS